MSPAATGAGDSDATVVARQLGREPRGPWRVARRCSHGYPVVLSVAPVLEGGTPFPTTFWLSCPHLCSVVSAAESAGETSEWAARIAGDPELVVSVAAADSLYRAARAIEGGGEDPCPSVGCAGQADPLAVKCLHARVAAAAAGLPDPIGRALLARGPLECAGARCAQTDGVLGPRRRAAIDIGTVTTRLLVADITPDGHVTEVVRRTKVTHLGRGLHATGELAAQGIQRVAETVASFMAEIAQLQVDEVFAVATSAARDASNGNRLLSTLDAIGIRPRIIPGATEARLSFLGATYELDGDGILVADLGGGSTELVVGSAGPGETGRDVTIEVARSIDVGSRRLLDMFLASDPPTTAELRDAAEWTAAQMSPFFDVLRAKPHSAVVLAGTGTSLSAVRQHLEVYDASLVHRSVLTVGELAELEAELAAMTCDERRHVVGLDPERADVIVAGTVILETILALAGLDEVMVSEHDILYGMVLEGA